MANNLFGKITKPQIAAALIEAGKPAPDLARWKKADLAAIAEQAMHGTGWLPAPVRITLADKLALEGTVPHQQDKDQEAE